MAFLIPGVAVFFTGDCALRVSTRGLSILGLPSLRFVSYLLGIDSSRHLAFRAG